MQCLKFVERDLSVKCLVGIMHWIAASWTLRRLRMAHKKAAEMMTLARQKGVKASVSKEAKHEQLWLS